MTLKGARSSPGAFTASERFALTPALFELPLITVLAIAFTRPHLLVINQDKLDIPEHRHRHDTMPHRRDLGEGLYAAGVDAAAEHEPVVGELEALDDVRDQVGAAASPLAPGVFVEDAVRHAGDLLATWVFKDPKRPKYLIDGLEGGMTPVGTFEKEVGAVTFRDGVLLIATQEYVNEHAKGRD